MWALSGLLSLLLLGAAGRSGAQTLLLSVEPSATSIQFSNSITYTISVTNFLGVSAGNVTISNIPSAAFQVVSNSFIRLPSQGTFTNDSSSAVFTIASLVSGDFAVMSLTLQPTVPGSFTNSVTALPFLPAGVLPVTSNVVTAVTLPGGDLGVSMAGPANTLYVNDPATYTMTVFNNGSQSAANVQLTTVLPPSKLLSVSPATQSYTLTGNSLVFPLGTMAGGTSQTIGVTVQPTNAGSFPVTASVHAPGFIDSNPANNSARFNLAVSDFLPGQFTVSNISSMVFDPQTSLMKQSIRLTNVGTNAAPAVRVVVAGLSNLLFNAVGTNDGKPYVLYAATLDVGQQVDLGLEYFIPSRRPITVPDSNYTALVVAAVDLSAPAGTGNTVSIRKVVPNNSILLEFPSITGASYTVLYSSDPNFQTNVLQAQPAITAPANRTQWIDDGPPKTISPPTDAASRFYRVRRN
jgi:uncharacterized repeat protein (TIGR01451 family)